MRKSSIRGRLLATTIIGGAALAGGLMPTRVHAQETAETVTEVIARKPSSSVAMSRPVKR
jgi:hypothetical protein